MAQELDHITVQTECPACDRWLRVTYKTMRLGRTIECPSCGETIRILDDTPLRRLQQLIYDFDEGLVGEAEDPSGTPSHRR